MHNFLDEFVFFFIILKNAPPSTELAANERLTLSHRLKIGKMVSQNCCFI